MALDCLKEILGKLSLWAWELRYYSFGATHLKEKPQNLDGSQAKGAGKGGIIPIFQGRPGREAVIGEQDITNLKITVHTSKDVLDFLDKI